MLEHDRQVLHGSTESDWRTPKELFAALDAIFEFDIDAAANEQNTLCSVWFGPGGRYPDALKQPYWMVGIADDQGGGYNDAQTVFVNPPYSKAAYRATKDPAYLVAAWAEKCYQESLKGLTIVGLFPYAVQTGWFRQWVYGQLFDPANVDSDDWGWSGHAADAIWKFPHRINFVRPDGTAAANAAINHCLCIWRPTRFVGPFQPAERYFTYREP